MENTKINNSLVACYELWIDDQEEFWAIRGMQDYQLDPNFPKIKVSSEENPGKDRGNAQENHRIPRGFFVFLDQNASCNRGKSPPKPPFSMVLASIGREWKDIKPTFPTSRNRGQQIDFLDKFSLPEVPWLRKVQVMGGTRAAPIFLTLDMESSDHVDNPTYLGYHEQVL